MKRKNLSSELVMSVLAEIGSEVFYPIDVYREINKSSGSISLSTVYRTLKNLEKRGVIQKHYTNNNVLEYIKIDGTPQHSMICKGCHMNIRFKDDKIREIILKITQEKGLEAIKHGLKIYIICSDCKTK